MRSGLVVATVHTGLAMSRQPINLTSEPGLNKVGNLLGIVHVVAVARQKRACAEINTNINPFHPPQCICKSRK